MTQDKAQFEINGYSRDICKLASVGEDQLFPARYPLPLTASGHTDIYHLYVIPHK